MPRLISQWSGSVQIAVLNANGQPIASPYNDETNGLAPLTLDLSSLNTGSGTGNPSVQGIIDAINQYYGPQGNKVELGNLNNIQMVSDTDSLPGSLSGNLTFDLNLDNISANPANVYVTGVTVTPTSGADTTTVTSPVDIGISSYTTIGGSSATVTVNTSGSTSGLTVGEQVYLSSPGTTVDGIPAGDLTGFFTVIGTVSTNSFTITAGGSATANSRRHYRSRRHGNGHAALRQPCRPARTAAPAADGLFNIALGSNNAAPYYTVTLNVAVDDGSGNPPATSQITYQVTNNQSNMLNNYYAPQTANGDGTIVAPTSKQTIAQAILVDANGNELPKDSNGNYINTENGYLEIKATNSNNVIAINSLDSTAAGAA